MIQVDMHMHSIYSDGCKDAKQLVENLIDNKIQLFALSDHDTIDGISEMVEAVKHTSLDFVPSVEISSTFEGREYHFLAYGFYENRDGLKELFDRHQNVRLQYDLDLIKALVEAKVQGVTFESFEHYKKNPYDGGWKSLNYLKSLGTIRDFMDYLDLTPKNIKKMVFTHPKDVFDLIHKCDGKVFLAHPSSNKAGGLPLRILDTFRAYGLDGIECYSPYHKTDDEINYYTDYCKRNNLLISGGSDYHGDFIGRKLGEPKITSSDIDYDFFKTLVL